MSRHRNVRTMNYDEDYEGYDDVYGHSVEDEYGVSPSVSEYLYDRSRGTQMSQFFSPEENIKEEPEDDGETHVERTRQRLDSLTIDSAVDEALADLVPEEEILLKSCVDEIHDVVGDSFPHNVIISHILHSKFNREKALDSLLKGVNIDPTTLTHHPKKLKSQPAPPAIVKPQPIKPKEPAKDHNNLLVNNNFTSLNGILSKNGLLAVEKNNLATTGSLVKSSIPIFASPSTSTSTSTPSTTSSDVGLASAPDSPSSPISLLASIASDHIKKLKDEDINNILNFGDCESAFERQKSEFDNPLMAIAKLSQKAAVVDLNQDINNGKIENPFTMTVKNPLFSLGPTSAPKPPGLVGGQQGQPQASKPINIAALSAFVGLGLSPTDANPLKSATNKCLDNLSSCSSSSLTRDHSPSSLSKNPLLGSSSIGSNNSFSGSGFCNNPLFGAINPLSAGPPKLPLVSPNNKGSPLTNGFITNPLLSKMAHPILPFPKMLEKPGASPLEKLGNNLPKKVDLTKPVPSPIVPLSRITKPPAPPPPAPPKNTRSQLRPARYKPKIKPVYEFGIVETKRKRLTEDDQISIFPVPFDNSHFDRSLIKDKPSSIGLRFVRRSTQRSDENVNLEVDENRRPYHEKVWSLLEKTLPEKIFKFDTPSPDALVGNATEFVGMRPNTTEELLSSVPILATTGDGDMMDTTSANEEREGGATGFSLEPRIETKVFPVLGPKKKKHGVPPSSSIKREKKKAQVPAPAPASQNFIDKSSNNNISSTNANKSKKSRPKNERPKSKKKSKD